MFFMIRSIELRNWKTHRDTKIEFRRGVNVILGVMGAGKSSVLDAMSYALFGSFPDLSSKRVSVGGLITSRPSEESSAEVRLSFDVDGSDYRVTRRISANSASTASLERDGRNLQSQPERVTEAVQELLKIDYDTFSRAIYAQQNRLDYFLDLSKGERKKGIDNMLGLDSFTIAEDNSTSVINSARSSIKEEEEALAAVNVRDFRAGLERLLGERRALEAQRTETEKAEKELRSRHALLGKDLEGKRLAYSRRKKLEEGIAELHSRMETISKESKKIEALAIDASVKEKLPLERKRLQALQKEVEALHTEESKRNRELAAQEQRLRQIDEDIARRERLSKETDASLLKDLERRLDASVKRLRELKASSISADNQARETEKWLSELREHVGKCPLCEQQLGAEARQRLIAEREQLVASLRSGIAGYSRDSKLEEESSKSLERELGALKLKLDRLKEYGDLDGTRKEAVASMEAKRALREAAAKGFETKSRESTSLLESVKTMEADADRLSRLDAYAKEIGECGTLLKPMEQELSLLSVDEKSLYALQDAFTELSSRLSDASSREEGIGKLLASTDQQIGEKQTSLDSFSGMEQRIRSRREMLSSMNKFKAALVDTEAALRNRLVSSLNSIMQGIWPELYPYQDYASLKIEARKDDYLLQACTPVNGSELWQPLDSIASGGERSVACLAMRIALSMVVVPNLRWIILDEPTHNIDSNGIARLVDVLGTTLPNIVEQVFVITHDDALKQIVGASVYQFDRDKAAQGFTTVTTG